MTQQGRPNRSDSQIVWKKEFDGVERIAGLEVARIDNPPDGEVSHVWVVQDKHLSSALYKEVGVNGIVVTRRFRPRKGTLLEVPFP